MAGTAPGTLPDLEALDIGELRTLLLATHERLVAREQEIEYLQLMIAKLRRMQFGRKSEKLDQQILQLQLRLDELATEQQNQDRPPELESPPTAESNSANPQGANAGPPAKPSSSSKHGRRKL